MAVAALAAGAVTSGIQTVAPATAGAAGAAPATNVPPVPAVTPQVLPTASPAADTTVLRTGSEGPAVRELQRVLNAWYPSRQPLAEDGVYGSATEGTVLHLQERAGILADGVAGPQTFGVLQMTPGAPVQPDVEQDVEQSVEEDVEPDTDDEADEDAEAAPAEPPAAAPGDVVAPADGEFTSGFGARWGSSHNGIDIANDIGTPILATTDGEIVESGPASGFGMWVRMQHSDGTISVYGHINESLVSEGQQIAAGEQIATMGNRGQSTGPHLHFEIWEDGGEKIDPLDWLQDNGVSL